MRMIPTCCWIFLCLCALPAPRARACTRPRQGLFAVNLITGTPDAQGQPIGNIAEGVDILLTGSCSDCTATLKDATGQTHTVTLEPIQPSYLWRLHPLQPLAAGRYTLELPPAQGDPPGTLMTYLFDVQGAASTTPLEFEIALDSDLDRLTSPGGTQIDCKEPGPCAGHMQAWTQSRPRLDITAAPKRPPTMPEMQGFVYRLLPSDDPKAADATNWSALSNPTLELRVSSTEQKPQYCVELQALRPSDLTIISVAKRCLSYTLPGPPYDPQPFSQCTTDQPEVYARAWCTDNEAGCSASNPRINEVEVSTACASYASLCAPFLGNRAQDQVCR